MEKNGGSCAGEQRFHVFVTDNLSTSVEMRVNADSGAVFPARSPCAAAALREAAVFGAVGGKRKDVAAVC